MNGALPSAISSDWYLRPPAIIWRARYSAVEPLEQLLLQLMMGIPVMPSSYSARLPLETKEERKKRRKYM